MAKDDILVINAAQMKERVRATKSGPGRMTTTITMSVKSEPITYNLTEKLLLKQAAEALANSIRTQTKAIGVPVKDSTAEARGVAERAFAKGKPWALKRYSGGRTGITPPVVGERRSYNHSGRLADGIVAAFVERTGEFVVNYPANRFNIKDWGSVAKMRLAIDRWIAMVPALREPSADIPTQRAFRNTHSEMVQKHAMGTEAKNATSKIKIATEIIRTATDILEAG